MTHIILAGDSIFDNAGYVKTGEAVIDHINAMVVSEQKATLLAVDGDVTLDLHKPFEKLPADASHLFISCGGNDALRVAKVLNEPVASVGEAMEIFTERMTSFQSQYRGMLTEAKKRVSRVCVCTVHDTVPGIEPRALTALGLFNEMILREAFIMGLPVIDLRLTCNDERDYSSISPIEPSEQGGAKISRLIYRVFKEHPFQCEQSRIYH